MKIYKFRPLLNCEDYQRLMTIIIGKKFWCSLFSELNDPMEGLFIANNQRVIQEIYNEKCKFRICSFSGKEALNNPSMWGYYAGGFKGVAIEVEVNESKVHKVKYVDGCVIAEKTTPKEILTRKFDCWKSEDEYRVLVKNACNENKIGKITAVYFGAPYDHAENIDQINGDSVSLRDYQCRKESIKQLLENENIQSFEVKINDGGQVVTVE